WTRPFAGVDGAGLERRHDLASRQSHHDGAQPPEDLGAEPGHPVAQPLVVPRRVDLAGEPSAHLATGVEAEERLDVELATERVPQLLTATVLDPREQLVCSEAKRHGREKIEPRRLLFKVVLVRV